MNTYGQFIVVDGIDGVGKSSQIEFIKDYFESLGEKVFITREPGGSLVAEDIRSIFKKITPEVIQPEAEMHMLLAARIQHLYATIIPKLKEGYVVISDRYEPATFAYQLYGREFPKLKFLEVWNTFQPEIKPDVTILLDLPPEKAMQRICIRGDASSDRLDGESLAFFERVRRGFLVYPEFIGDKYPIFTICADRPKEQIADDIIDKLNCMRSLSGNR
ncbi:dTMP kinase [Vibrio harveyi]|uniref:dTMP kinase n=1 Tax=Vibrio harveyi TaxID=669 RepID=UPI003CF3551E